MNPDDLAAYNTVKDALQAHGYRVKETGQGTAQAQCPAHDDNNPSLSIGPRRDGKGIVLHCHAGCDNRDIVAEIGLTMSDLFDDSGMRAAYADRADYTYPGGRNVHRKPGKDFLQSGNKKDRSLFHGDRIGDTATVYVCEGEKDVLAVEAVGGVAVCSAMGAGKADKFDWAVLAGKHAIIIADKDKPGRKHATQIAELVGGVAGSVRIVEAKGGKDAADHIAAGYSIDEFVEATNHSGGNDTPKLWRATDLRSGERPRWLAKDRLPRASVTLLIGDEGIGKSLLWGWIIAAVTTGKPLPEFGIPERDPGHVVIVITEDDWTTTVQPRLEVAGVDLAMVSVVCTEEDGSGAPVFPRDLPLIREADPAPALIVVDAWLDTVPPGLSVRDPQQARQALHPLKEIATVTDAAVMLLCHTNRISTANARDKYGATGELRKKARMTLFAQADDDGCLVVGPEKSNMTRSGVAASKFTIGEVQHFNPTDDCDGKIPLLSYAGESERTAREHLADNYAADHEPGGGDGAVGWLAAYLAAGPRWSVEVHNAREQAEISEKKLRSAKKRLNVESRRAANDGPWFMALPQHSERLPDTQASPDDPISDAWASGTSGGHVETPHALSTSQDSLMTNEEIQGRLEDTPPPAITAMQPLRFDSDPPCYHCGQRVTGRQRDGQGRWAHFKCQQTAQR